MLAAISQRTAAARVGEAAAERLVPLRADPGRARYQLAWLTGQRSSSLRDGYLYWMGPELYGVKWRNFKLAFVAQQYSTDTAGKLSSPVASLKMSVAATSTVSMENRTLRAGGQAVRIHCTLITANTRQGGIARI